MLLLLGGGPWWRHVPVPGRSLFGLLAVAVAAAASVRMGRDARDRSRLWRVADLAAGFAVVVIAFQALTGSPALPYVEVVHETWEPPVLRHPDGEPITNLYPFDAQGNALDGVYIYDGAGRPVEIGDLAASGFEDIETAHPRDTSGNPVTNRYPQEQYTVQYDRGGDPRSGARGDHAGIGARRGYAGAGARGGHLGSGIGR